MRNYEVISGKLDRITNWTMVVETTKIVIFQIFASPMKEVDASSSSSSSSSSSCICHVVGPLVDPFRSHVSRSLFKGLP